MLRKVFCFSLIFLVYSSIVFSQDTSFLKSQLNSNSSENQDFFTTPAKQNTFPLAIGIAGFLYLLNPILLFENDKIGGGITKEFSVGFGYFGEYRTALEYSYIFRSNQSSHIRLSGKYDYLLSDLRPSNNFQTSSVVSIGCGLFYDFDGFGYFPEVSLGWSIRNHKLLFYPHIKARYTLMFEERKSNIADFSFGIVIGIANPFIDLKIRRFNQSGN